MPNKTVTFPENEFRTLCNLFQLMAIGGLKLNGEGSAIPSEDAIQAVWGTLRDSVLSPDTELEFLRFYFEKVYVCLGPADDDIVSSIKEEFTKKTGKAVPEGY